MPNSTSSDNQWWQQPPQTLDGALFRIQQRAAHIEDSTEEGEALRRLLDFVEQQYEILNDEVRGLHPLAFFKPSYEQSLLLNSWIWGIDFPVCFSANRIGKTTAFVVNALLWLLPNDPNWECFYPQKTHGVNRDGDAILIDNPHVSERLYKDHQGRQVQLLPRPKMSTLMEIRDVIKRYPELFGDPLHSHLDEPSGNYKKFVTLQSLVPALLQTEGCWPHPPIYDTTAVGTIWLGAPDNDFHSEVILKEWKRWTPKQYISKWVQSELYFHLDTKDSTNPRPMKWEIYCKSYESEDTKWSGSAVYGIVLTEGMTPAVLNEVKMRIKEGGFASWDYTPYEATNAGQKTALAHKVFTGKEQLPLRSFIFTRFSARNAPNFILPESKRLDLIRIWEGKKEGEARLDGMFYSTSPLILSRLDRPFHTLPWTKEELFEKFPTGQLYRGFDAGYDHPSVCAWALLAPGNQWFFYRFYSERGRTIPERCEDIITLSGNVRRQFKLPGTNQVIYKEMHITPHSEVFNLTAADYHLFKTDETSGIPYVNNYHREGLILTESTHMKPEDRALEFDRKLTPNKFITHPLTSKTPGASIFFLINEPGVDPALQKMESLYWERLHGGPNKGEAKDTVPIHGDDELDAACYLVCGPYNYNHFRPKPNVHFLEEEENLVTLQKY